MIKEIFVKELDKILKDSKKKKDYFVLDVRQSEERTYGTIKGDVLIPMGEISERLDEIPKNKKIVVYCRSGSRSMEVGNFLQFKKFDVVNLRGGILSWKEIDPSVILY